MTSGINNLKIVWDKGRKTARQNTKLPLFDFDVLLSSIISTGPFYYYIVDFFDMSISHVSPSIYDIHGFDPITVKFEDIIKAIHPDDIEFVSKAEAYVIDFIYAKRDRKNVLNYKTNYSFRSKMKNGSYELLNHQAVVLTIDDKGRFGKVLNIHTNVNHITTRHNNTVSLLSLNNDPSFVNIKISSHVDDYILFTKREIEIIKAISEGMFNNKIADKLNISVGTVKKHRNNIYLKSGCKNSVELINKSIFQGLI